MLSPIIERNSLSKSQNYTIVKGNKWMLSLNQMRILIVEDNGLESHLLEALLKAEGAQVFKAENGQEALNLLDDVEVDIVVTDTNMPVMNGVVLLNKIKETRPELPVIIYFSASLPNLQITKEDLYCMGADQVMTKPYKIDVLSRVINNIISP